MKRPVVAFDVDGVLADFQYAWSSLGNMLHGIERFHDYEHKQWDFDDVLSRKQQDEMWDVVTGTRKWWLGLDKTRELKNVDEDLLKDVLERCRVYFVTSRPESDPSIQWQTSEWLEHHLPGDTEPCVIVMDKPEDKAGLFSWLGVEYAIEDRADTSEQVVALDYPELQGMFLMARRYNEKFKKHKKLRRIDTLNTFLAAIPLDKHEESEDEESPDRE